MIAVNKEKKKTVSIVMPEPLYLRLKEMAAEDTRTFAAEVRQILKGYVEYIDRGGVSWCSGMGTRGVEQYLKS